MYYKIGTFRLGDLHILKDKFYPKEGDIIDLRYGNGRSIGIFTAVKPDTDIGSLQICEECALMSSIGYPWCKYRRIDSNGYRPICCKAESRSERIRFKSIDNIMEDL